MVILSTRTCICKVQLMDYMRLGLIENLESFEVKFHWSKGRFARSMKIFRVNRDFHAFEFVTSRFVCVIDNTLWWNTDDLYEQGACQFLLAIWLNITIFIFFKLTPIWRLHNIIKQQCRSYKNTMNSLNWSF